MESTMDNASLDDYDDLESQGSYLEAKYEPVEEDYDMLRPNVKKYVEEFISGHPTAKKDMVPYVEKNLLGGKAANWGAAANILINADESGHMKKIAEHYKSDFMNIIRFVLSRKCNFVLDKKTGQIIGVNPNKIKRIK
jgi:hypothetical protein